MATPPADKKAVVDESFLREVDDAVRRSDLENFGRRFGLWLGGLILVGLAAFGGYILWHNQQQKAAGEVAENYVKTLDLVGGANKDAAIKALEQFDAKGQGSYDAMADMMRANILAEQGKVKEAGDAYAALAANADLPEAVRNLALLREVAAKFDTMPPQQAIDRLKPLATPGAPFFPSAAELSALAWLKLGKRDIAGQLFADIAKDKGAPESLSARARQMAGVLGVDTVDDKENGGETDKAKTGTETGAPKGETE